MQGDAKAGEESYGIGFFLAGTTTSFAAKGTYADFEVSNRAATSNWFLLRSFYTW